MIDFKNDGGLMEFIFDETKLLGGIKKYPNNILISIPL